MLDAGVAEIKERLRDKRGRQARTRKLPSQRKDQWLREKRLEQNQDHRGDQKQPAYEKAL
jgi:hypothetical protein